MPQTVSQYRPTGNVPDSLGIAEVAVIIRKFLRRPKAKS